MKYTIYHPTSRVVNHECYEHIYFSAVTDINADSLEKAYRKAQNDCEESHYHFLNVRSTSVGDLIVSTDGNIYMVMGKGFKEIAGFAEMDAPKPRASRYCCKLITGDIIESPEPLTFGYDGGITEDFRDICTLNRKSVKDLYFQRTDVKLFWSTL